MYILRTICALLPVTQVIPCQNSHVGASTMCKQNGQCVLEGGGRPLQNQEGPGVDSLYIKGFMCIGSAKIYYYVTRLTYVA